MSTYAFQRVAFDNGQRADENPINPANWTLPTGGYQTALQLKNNLIQPQNGTAFGEGNFTGASVGANQYASAIVAANNPVYRVYVGIRQDATGLEGYEFGFAGDLGSSGTFYLADNSGEGFSISCTGVLNEGDKITVYANGTRIAGQVNGVDVLVQTDSNYANGLPALTVVGSAAASYFECGNVFESTGSLDFNNPGDTLTQDQINSIANPGADNGHIAYSTVYSGTIRNWNGELGIIFADSGQGDAALPVQHSGEGPLVRVQLADVTYAPTQGDRVKFLLYRTSAGDKLAKALSLIS